MTVLILSKLREPSLPVCFTSQRFRALNEEGFLANCFLSTEFADIQWHILSIEELLRRFGTSSRQGLSTEQAMERLREYGRNVPTPPPSRILKKIFGYAFGGFGSILLVAAILVFVAWKPLGQPPLPANLALGIVLLVVFFVQFGFNAWQDWSSSRVMASITTMLPDHCILIREGIRTEVVSSEIVPGDFIFIKAGVKLPADVRFTECSPDAKFDRAILTG
jgi:sodium/potassium-transporting ATPase subunit alpha